MKPSLLRTVSIMSCLIIALCSQTTFATRAPKQGSSRPSPIDRRVEHMGRQGEQYQRDTLRGPDGKTQKPAQRQATQAAIAEVKHDFERLQESYNQIVLAMSGSGALEHKPISDATAEIKKCAVRLKKNLALPAPENKVGGEETASLKEEEIKPSLRRLCLHIANFVMNPAFETLTVVDVEQSSKAGKDLEEIIRLSDLVWKSTNKPGEEKK